VSRATAAAGALRRGRLRALGARAAASASRPAGAHLPRLRRPRPRTLVATGLLAVLLAAGWFWLRDSSLVAVRDVEVSGVPGARNAQIRAALDRAARSMTTLHVRRDALEAAVAPYPLVKDVEVSTSFPHAMRIHVVTNVAVGAVLAAGRRIPVTSDGTLLRDVAASPSLATIGLRAPPGGRRLTGPTALAAVAALAAAPDALREHVASAATTRAHGLTLQIANGPVLWLGDDARLAAKWAAAAAVLADPAAAGATSIDISDPERPAVGGLPGGVQPGGQSDIPAAPDPTTTTPDQGAAAPAGVANAPPPG
jgi:cell division protein FtsQ